MAYYAPTSRYKSDAVKITASRRPSTSGRQYTLYVVREGDTLERIARAHLGTSNRWWEIADMNPQVKYPLNLTVGTVLRLPL